ncbi:hypothetical protein RCL1_007256 [Eukaryota sp. TZLM3-RCL]
MSEGPQTVDIASLPPQALENILRQTEQEASIIRSSIVQLKSAQARFRQSRDALEHSNNVPVGSPLLVPLTESLYVSGRTRDPSKVLLEIGTGYFTERTLEEAKSYFNRRIKYLDGRLKELSEAFEQKKQLSSVTLSLLERHKTNAPQQQ